MKKMKSGKAGGPDVMEMPQREDIWTEFNTVLEREGMPEKCRRSEVALIFKNKGPEL